jgi:hypothetical protein
MNAFDRLTRDVRSRVDIPDEERVEVDHANCREGARKIERQSEIKDSERSSPVPSAPLIAINPNSSLTAIARTVVS